MLHKKYLTATNRYAVTPFLGEHGFLQKVLGKMNISNHFLTVF